MDKKQIENSVRNFNKFLEKLNVWQFGISTVILLIVLILWYWPGVEINVRLIAGLAFISLFLLLESTYLILHPYFFSNKFGSCQSDLLDFKGKINIKLKISSLIFGAGVIAALLCVFVSSLKSQIPLAVPFVLLGALQLTKWQLIVYRCWILEDEFSRMK